MPFLPTYLTPLRSYDAGMGHRRAAASHGAGRRAMDAPCSQLARITRSLVRATARNVTLPCAAMAWERARDKAQPQTTRTSAPSEF